MKNMQLGNYFISTAMLLVCVNAGNPFCEKLQNEINEKLAADDYTAERSYIANDDAVRKIVNMCDRFLDCKEEGCEEAFLENHGACSACSSILIPRKHHVHSHKNEWHHLKLINTTMGFTVRTTPWGTKINFTGFKRCKEIPTEKWAENKCLWRNRLMDCKKANKTVIENMCSYSDTCSGNSDCQQKEEPKLIPAILNGDVSDVTEHPWLSFLSFSTSRSATKNQCGGSWVSRNAIVTAQHCLVDVVRGDATFATMNNNGRDKNGKLNLREFDASNIHFPVNQWEMDVAVIKFRKPVAEGTPNFKLLPIPQSGDYPEVGSYGTVSGWGYKCNDPPHCKLQTELATVARTLDIEIHEPSECGSEFERNPWDFCAGGMQGDVPKDACEGDSGGPVECISKRDRSTFLCGIVSKGPKTGHCGFSPGTYVNVSYPDVVDFITSAVNAKVVVNVGVGYEDVEEIITSSFTENKASYHVTMIISLIAIFTR